MNTFVLQEEARPLSLSNCCSSWLHLFLLSAGEILDMYWKLWTTGSVVSHLPQPSFIRPLVNTWHLRDPSWVLVYIPGACICLPFHVPRAPPGLAAQLTHSWDSLNPRAKCLLKALPTRESPATQRNFLPFLQTMALGITWKAMRTVT